MPAGAAILGSSLIGAGAQMWGAQRGANAITGAANQTDNRLRWFFKVAQDALSPYYTAGKSAIPTLKSLLTPGPSQTDTLSQIPGFQFIQDWGQKAVQAQGARMGYGGNVLKAGSDFATGTAQSQAFFPLINALQSFMNTGAGAAGQLGGVASNFGNTTANTLMSAGTAQAGSAISQGNTLASLFGNIGNMSLLDRLTGGQILGMYGPQQQDASGNPSNAMFGSNPFTPFGGINPAYGG